MCIITPLNFLYVCVRIYDNAFKEDNYTQLRS